MRLLDLGYRRGARGLQTTSNLGVGTESFGSSLGVATNPSESPLAGYSPTESYLEGDENYASDIPGGAFSDDFYKYKTEADNALLAPPSLGVEAPSSIYPGGVSIEGAPIAIPKMEVAPLVDPNAHQFITDSTKIEGPKPDRNSAQGGALINAVGTGASMVGSALGKGAQSELKQEAKIQDEQLKDMKAKEFDIFSKAPSKSDFSVSETKRSGKAVGASTLKGLGAGASIGTAIGSVVPAIGNVVGGIIGAVVGSIGGLISGLVGGKRRARRQNAAAREEARRAYEEQLRKWRAARTKHMTERNSALFEQTKKDRERKRQEALRWGAESAKQNQNAIKGTGSRSLEDLYTLGTGFGGYNAPLMKVEY